MRLESHYRHFLFLAIGYAAVLFVGSFLALKPFGWPLIVSVFGFVFGIIHLAAFWSVFGPGSYLKRSLGAFGLAILPAIGFLLGLMSVGLGVDFQFRDIVGLASTAPVFWACAQIPSWVLRHFKGWHIASSVTKETDSQTPGQLKNSRQPRTSIMDMMVFTGTIAFGFGALEFGKHFSTATNDFSWLILANFALLFSYLMLSLPIAWVTIRKDANREAGCLGLLVYCFVVSMLVFFVASFATSGSAMASTNIALAILICMASFICSFGLPMIISHQQGFELKTNRSDPFAQPEKRV